MQTLIVFFMALTLLQSPATSSDLLEAIRHGNHAAVQRLLEADAAVMKLLIERGAAVNAQNSAGSTALMYAATNAVKATILLDAGAEVGVRSSRNATAMTVAVTTYGSTPVLKLLAAKGATATDAMMTAAAQKGDIEAMQFLLSLGVSPGGPDSAPISAALGARCDACIRLLLEHGAVVTGVRANGSGVLSQTAKRAMPEMAQLMLEKGASLAVKDREGFTLLMQSVMSLEPETERDRMVQWLLDRGVDPNETNERGQTAYQLADRNGLKSTMEILAAAGARRVADTERPKPAGGTDVRSAIEKALPWMETGGEAVFKNRACISCHNNSLPAMAIYLAREKGFAINETQAKKELGFAIATEKPFFELMRGGTAIGGGVDTVGYTLMGMAAAGYPADPLTDAHIHYLSIQQYPDGSWKTTSYRPPSEYSPLATTAVALRAIRLYPLPGRQAEFDERLARAKRWLLGAKAFSSDERAMQLIGLADSRSTAEEIAPFVAAIRAAQNPDGSWSQLPTIAGDAYATGQMLYALHLSGGVATNDPAYSRGVQWLLQHQLEDGTWFVPARTTPTQPFFPSGFPHGPNQWASDAGTSWASLALLLTLPDNASSTNR